MKYKSIGRWLEKFMVKLWRKSLEAVPQKRIVIIGNPNVGKSLVFNRLTGIYVTVSNYPGTTVEIFRGRTYINGVLYEVIDTPGMYSLLPSSEEERVARRLLLEERPDVVIHIVEAKNLERMLPLTVQMIEAGFPVIMALNMMDEVERIGLRIDTDKLISLLNIPIVEVIATQGRGIQELRGAINAVTNGNISDAIRASFGGSSGANQAMAAS